MKEKNKKKSTNRLIPIAVLLMLFAGAMSTLEKKDTDTPPTPPSSGYSVSIFFF